MHLFSTLLIFTWAFLDSAVRSSTCPSPFTQLSGGYCVYWNASYSVNWCQAAEFCLSIGGELAIDIGLIRAARTGLVTNQSFIGMTDLLIERGTNRMGWQLTNGSFANLSDSDWISNAPDSLGADDDFVLVSPSGLIDVRVVNPRPFLCQPLVTPNSHLFTRASFLRLGEISPFYCYSELTGIMYELECALRCADRWQCRAAIYNKADGRCRMLDFTDASVGDAIEKNANWTKIVKVY